MDKQNDTLGTVDALNLCDDILRDLLDSEVMLIGGGEVLVNGY